VAWWRRPRDKAAPPAGAAAGAAGPGAGPARRDWATLPPLQRATGEIALTARTAPFTASLVTWRDPSFLAPLGHSVDPNAPAGLVEGVVMGRTGASAAAPGSTATAVQRSPDLVLAGRGSGSAGLAGRVVDAPGVPDGVPHCGGAGAVAGPDASADVNGSTADAAGYVDELGDEPSTTRGSDAAVLRAQSDAAGPGGGTGGPDPRLPAAPLLTAADPALPARPLPSVQRGPVAAAMVEPVAQGGPAQEPVAPEPPGSSAPAPVRGLRRFSDEPGTAQWTATSPIESAAIGTASVDAVPAGVPPASRPTDLPASSREWAGRAPRLRGRLGPPLSTVPPTAQRSPAAVPSPPGPAPSPRPSPSPAGSAGPMPESPVDSGTGSSGGAGVLPPGEPVVVSRWVAGTGTVSTVGAGTAALGQLSGGAGTVPPYDPGTAPSVDGARPGSGSAAGGGGPVQADRDAGIGGESPPQRATLGTAPVGAGSDPPAVQRRPAGEPAAQGSMAGTAAVQRAAPPADWGVAGHAPRAGQGSAGGPTTCGVPDTVAGSAGSAGVAGTAGWGG